MAISAGVWKVRVGANVARMAGQVKRGARSGIHALGGPLVLRFGRAVPGEGQRPRHKHDPDQNQKCSSSKLAKHCPASCVSSENSGANARAHLIVNFWLTARCPATRLAG